MGKLGFLDTKISKLSLEHICCQSQGVLQELIKDSESEWMNGP